MNEITRRRFLGFALGSAVTPFPQIVPGPLDIKPRRSWATDRPPKRPMAAEEVRFLLVHHTAAGNGHVAGDVPSILRDIFDFHTGPDREWDDIAYNFLIDAEGGIWEGRAGSLGGPVVGDATGGNQGFSQLVCLIGNFETMEPTPASLASLVGLLASLADRYGVATEPDSEVTFVSRGSGLWPSGASVTTSTITGHRTMSQTSCPGSNLNGYVTGALMADVNAARSAALAAVSPSTPPPTPSTTVDDLVPATSSTTTTTFPPTPPPTRSPLLLAAAILATLTTLLAAWRARRMGDR